MSEFVAQFELRRLLAGFDIPMILVTHDRHEAFALAEHLIVMDEGRILQSGAIEDVFFRPADQRVARMVGVETIQPARVINRCDGMATVELGRARLTALAGSNAGDDVLVCVRAEDVELESAGVEPDDLSNRLAATIRSVVPERAMLRLDLDCGFELAALIPRQLAAGRTMDVGSIITIAVPAAAVHLIAKATTTR